eukprot:c23550_g1_i1 orf=889-1659(+)
MDVEKVKGKKRGIANGGGEVVLQWGNSKRLRGVKKEPSVANTVFKKTIKTQRQVSQTKKQAWKPGKQALGDQKSYPSEATPGRCQNKKPIKRYNSCVSSALESKSITKHKLSTPSKSLAKSKAGKNSLEKFDKTIISTTKDKEMVVARRGLEAGIHIGTFHDEMQNLEVYLMPKFMIALSHKEKEEDFMAIKGSKLPIRPRRRAKHVQKALHCVSPGSWLCELSFDRYEVREKKNVKKKSWGLKAMTNADSDSLKS